MNPVRQLPALFGALLLWGCGLPIAPSDGEPGSGFPHPEGWVFEHGPTARGGSETCLLCHDGEAQEDVDYHDGTTLPPCNGCHAWPLDERPEGARETAARAAAPTGGRG